MSLLKEVTATPCALAFSDDGDYLAVGVHALNASEFPALRLLSTSASSYLSTDELLGEAASYLSPAGFARLAWSKPGEGSSGGGLVAGGLRNGTVAVWDPVDIPILDSCYGNTMQSDFPVLLDKTCGNLRMSHLAESSDGEQGHPVKAFISPEDIVIIPEYFSSNQERVRPLPMFVDRYNGMEKMVAMFSGHDGAVHGLAFSPHAPSFLISGASQGKIVLWDLAKTFSDTVPTSEFVISNGDLSFVAWSPTIANLIATTTSAGETVVLDLRTKKKTVSHHQIDAVMSTVQWAAFDPNEILTGASQTSSSYLPFNLWDLRKPNEPLKSFGKEISGANYISFCPLDGDKFLASTNEDIYTWSLKDGQINGCVLCGLPCGEVHYRPGSEELLAASTEQGVRAYKWEIIDNTDCPDTIE